MMPLRAHAHFVNAPSVHAMSRLPRFAVLFLVFFALTATTTRAQTPATTVRDSDDTVVLQSNADGGLLAPGEFGTGTIPTEGAGTRLMWDPARAALRAGTVGGAQWDESNVGDYSVGLGKNTTASGPQAVAIGTQTTARGIDAFAAGRSTDAFGSASTALGTNTQVSADHAVAVGRCNPATGPDDLFVVGNGSVNLVNGDCDDRSNAFRLTSVGNMTIENDLTAGGSVFAEDFITTSDRRLKTNVTPLGDSVLTALAELRPVRFQFKASTGYDPRPEIGLIAQEVQRAFPSLVHENDDGMLSLAYPKLTAVLVKGLQEQQAQIEEHRAALRDKQAQIDSLKRQGRQIDAMRHRLAALEAEHRSRAAGWMATTPLRSIALLLIGSMLGAGLLLLRRR